MADAAQAKAGLDGVVVTTTGVSFLDTEQEEIVVRGYNLIELAEQLSYPHAVYLLLYGEVPSRDEAARFEKTLREEGALPREAYELFRLIPNEMGPMDALRTSLSFLAGFDPEVDDNSREANRRKSVRALAKLPEAVGNGYRIQQGMDPITPDPALSYSENFLFGVTGKRPGKTETRIFDMTLSCYIDHEMPNSTFTARVIASTLSDIYGALVGGVASLKGPLHGGANEAAVKMLVDIGEPERARDYILDKLRNKGRIMGFGHRVYMGKPDPRAQLLQKYVPDLAKLKPEGTKLYDIYNVVTKTMYEEKGLFPNTDYPIGFIYYLLGIPIELYTPIFFIARTAGIAAHVIEQHENNRLYRPRVAYDGPRGLHPLPESAAG